jgi:hypothetical protein
MSRVAVDEILDRYPTHRTASPAVLQDIQPAHKYPPRQALAAARGFWRQWKRNWASRPARCWACCNTSA